MSKLFSILFFVLFLSYSAKAEDIASETSSRFSIGAGLGITEFDARSIVHPSTAFDLRVEWDPQALLGVVLGGARSASSGDDWHANLDTVMIQVQIHPLRSTPSTRGFDPYLLLGTSEIFHNFHDDFPNSQNAVIRQHDTQWNAGLGANYVFTSRLGAWGEVMAGRETNGNPIYYGTSFTGRLGIKYFL